MREITATIEENGVPIYSNIEIEVDSTGRIGKFFIEADGAKLSGGEPCRVILSDGRSAPVNIRIMSEPVGGLYGVVFIALRAFK